MRVHFRKRVKTRFGDWFEELFPHPLTPANPQGNARYVWSRVRCHVNATQPAIEVVSNGAAVEGQGQVVPGILCRRVERVYARVLPQRQTIRLDMNEIHPASMRVERRHKSFVLHSSIVPARSTCCRLLLAAHTTKSSAPSKPSA